MQCVPRKVGKHGWFSIVRSAKPHSFDCEMFGERSKAEKQFNLLPAKECALLLNSNTNEIICKHGDLQHLDACLTHATELGL